MFKSWFDVEVLKDRLGCLQDIHWSMGAFGYFPTYTLGNLYAAQLLEAMAADLKHRRHGCIGRLGADAGVVATPHPSTTRSRRLNSLKTPRALRQVPEPFLRYVERKYSALYQAG